MNKTWQTYTEDAIMLICAGLIVWAMLYAFTKPDTPTRPMSAEQIEALIEYQTLDCGPGGYGC